MKNELPRAATASTGPIPTCYFGDDATSADQIALAIVEILGRRVITTDTNLLDPGGQSFDEGVIRVVNSRTRALSPAEADARNQHLVRQLCSAVNLPVVQIDSRLRGIGNALRGVYEALDFDYLLFVPAEPELGRLVKDGVFCHLEDGRRIPFHQSVLANPSESPIQNSDLRDFIAAELQVSTDRIVLIDEEVVSQGLDAIVYFIRGTKRTDKCILLPDVTKTEHFEAVISASKKLEQAGILIAGSRTFLRSFFTCLGICNAGIQQMKSLSQAIDTQKRGAPLAVISSLEPAMNAQVEYAQRAIGPNLVTVGFDSSVVLCDDQTVSREIDRTRQLVLQSLKASRPVLLHTSRSAAFTDPAVQQKHLEAISQVVADESIVGCLSSLFISGGQTAETIKKAMGITAIEIKGAFQESIPWGIPLEGAFKDIPFVTKGGRMGAENVLFEFLDQGHPLPRANVLPVVTPVTKDKKVDEQGIEKLVAHLVRLGTTDIFAVGNAGEFRFLTNEQRLEAIDLFTRKAQGKLRVFAGITGDTAEQTRYNYEAVGKLGVVAAVVMPLYFLKNSEEIVPFVESLGSIQTKLPLVLYNNPERTNKQNISFEAVESLRFPVVAIKDSSGDLDRLDRYARSMPVYEGQQRQFIEGYEHGARGAIGIIGHASALPNEFFAPTTTAARRKEIAGQINDLSKVVKQGGAEVAAYKYVLSLMGVMGDTVASDEAARELTADQRELIRVNNAELISRMTASAVQ